MTKSDNPYGNEGFFNREEYLDYLREQIGKENEWKLNALLDILPESEDFDGLINSLRDEGLNVSI